MIPLPPSTFVCMSYTHILYITTIYPSNLKHYINTLLPCKSSNTTQVLTVVPIMSFITEKIQFRIMCWVHWSCLFSLLQSGTLPQFFLDVHDLERPVIVGCLSMWFLSDASLLLDSSLAGVSQKWLLGRKITFPLPFLFNVRRPAY